MAAEATLLNGGPTKWQKFMDANVANNTNIWGGSQQAQGLAVRLFPSHLAHRTSPVALHPTPIILTTK